MKCDVDNLLEPSQIMHEIMNDVSTIMSISQLALINGEEMSPKMRVELKRIIDTARNLSKGIHNLADILQEDG